MLGNLWWDTLLYVLSGSSFHYYFLFPPLSSHSYPTPPTFSLYLGDLFRLGRTGIYTSAPEGLLSTWMTILNL